VEIPADQMHTQADVDVLFVHETGIIPVEFVPGA